MIQHVERCPTCHTAIGNNGLSQGIVEELDDDDTEKYSAVCDVIERIYHDMPLEDDTGIRHTSAEARAGALRIFEILGITM
jgi:hypothetical protein